jgi:hypothetical protein
MLLKYNNFLKIIFKEKSKKKKSITTKEISRRKGHSSTKKTLSFISYSFSMI